MLTFILLISLFLVSAFFFLTSPVLAQCPVCIVTVGGGMLIARKLGVDDFLVSFWLSALNTAIAFWLATKVRLKLLKNAYFMSFLFFLMSLSYFYFTDQINSQNNLLLGVDKIILGTLLGMLAMFAGNGFYTYIKAKNQGKTPFPYAKVIFPLSLLLLLTLLFKLIFKL